MDKSGGRLRGLLSRYDSDEEEAELGSTVEQVVLRSSCPVASVNHPDKVKDVV